MSTNSQRVSIESEKTLKELEKKMKKMSMQMNYVIFVFELVSQDTILALYELNFNFQHQFSPNKNRHDSHIKCLI